MSKCRRVVLLGEAEECREAIKILSGLPWFDGYQLEFRHTALRDELFDHLMVWKPGLAIILSNGANGMEGVYAVKKHYPDIPVFWFSDDHEFGMQSHRLECAYFAVKPLTEEKARRAFLRCSHIGMDF